MRSSGQLVAFCGSLAFAIVIATFALTNQTSTQNAPTVLKPGNTYYNLSTVSACQKLYGLRSVQRVVDSAYLYEYNLLDYSTPVADIDCTFYPGWQEDVHLPGFTSDHYTYAGTVYVYGSGYVSKWIAPNGGHIAFVHLGVTYTGVSAVPQVTLPPIIAKTTANLDEGNNTARAVGDVVTLPPPGAPSNTNWVGTRAIGQSRWPDDPAFGNGLGGLYNAQLCVIMDATAANWLESIVSGLHHAPNPGFPIKKWQSKKKIFPYDGHHHLIWAADFWWHHAQWLGGALDNGHYYGWQKTKSDPHPHAYTETKFVHGSLRCWNFYHTCKASGR